MLNSIWNNIKENLNLRTSDFNENDNLVWLENQRSIG